MTQKIDTNPFASEAVDVSVCIANYNGLSVIQECIDSIYAQLDNDLTVEIIVHDDASTDESTMLIERLYPEIVLIRSKENVGFCISNNRMAELANGKYILLLNNDATLFPDALKTLHREAKRNPDGILTLPQYDAQNGKLIDCGQNLDIFGNAIPQTHLVTQEVASAMGACLWVPKSLWRAIGGFPDWFQSMAEDLFLCCAARIMNHPVIAIGESGYNHIVGKSFGGGKIIKNKLNSSMTRRQLSERNKIFVMACCYPGLTIYLILPIHFFLLLTEGLVLSAIKLKPALFRKIYAYAIQQLFSNFKRIGLTRAKIQAERTVSVFHFFTPFKIFPQKLHLLIHHGIPSIK